MSTTMDRSKLKIAFFGRTISISETFIKQLLFGLNERTYLTFINGQNEVANYDNVKEIASGVKVIPRVLKNRYSNLLLRKLTPNLVLDITKRQAFKKLQKSLSGQNFDLAYTDYGMSAVQILPYLKYRKIPLVVHFHGYDITSELNNKEYRKELQNIFSYSKFIIAASHHIKRLLILEGCPTSKIRIVRYGISLPDNFKGLEWQEKFKSDPKITFIGRLVEKKNPLALIHAFEILLRKHPNAKLHIIGDGNLFEICKKRVAKINIGKSVVFHGALSHDQIFIHLKDTWIYAQHSVTSLAGDQEGFAISPAEAALAGIPVVSTFHNGIPEHVIHNKTGLLCQEFDFETMGQHLLYLLDNKDELIKYGERGRLNIQSLCVQNKRITEIVKIMSEASANC
ncbi:glycosyltransferase family 4 protein [Phaeodactylibacter xiamenensis]|uniref:glycosyltransferase family 4 protein n=1 Tax=Phaeodactylibacter xiamenensis TaxID=1524460 RepID=UPI0024A8AF3F|nr:glycosyltransferase family 4 protein [Phaeodactylibacter xiamenensis]